MNRLPIITKVANRKRDSYDALLYPLHNKIDSITNDISKIIALSINLGFPNGIAINPNTVIETKVIREAR